MNLDELVDSVGEPGPRARLSRWVEQWKSDDSDVDELSKVIDKWHGDTWFADRGAQDDFYGRFRNFREGIIRNIGGMTLNERLYWFGLSDAWDEADDAACARIRSKLRARA